MNSQNVEKKTGTHTKLRQLRPWFTRSIFLGLFLWTFLCKSLIVLVMRVSPLMFVLWACSGFRGAFHSVLGWTSLSIVLAVFVLCVVLPRCFCRFLCPQGTILTVLRHLRSSCLNGLRGVSTKIDTTASARRTPWRNLWKRFPWSSFGAAVVIYLIGNAMLERDSKLLLIWTDPLVMLRAWQTDWNLKNVPILLCLSIWMFELWRPGRWCRNCCPTGAVQDFLALPLKYWKRRKRNRVHQSPEKMADSENLVTSQCERLPQCERCRDVACQNVQSCNAQCHNVCLQKANVPNDIMAYRYRPLLALLMTCGWVAFLDRWGRWNTRTSDGIDGMNTDGIDDSGDINDSNGTENRVNTTDTANTANQVTSTKSFRLRPPGAVPERQFTSLCARCGNCATVCSTGLIYHPLEWSSVSATPSVTANQNENLPSHSLSNPSSALHELGLPVLRFDPAYCEARCTACTEVCQTGALMPLTVEEKRLHPIGLATLDWSRCLLYESHECRICARECPQLAIDIVWSEAEYLPVPTIDAANCTGCGRCLVFCPAKCLAILPR